MIPPSFLRMLTLAHQVAEQMLREYKEICKSLFGFSVSRLADAQKSSGDQATVQYTVRASVCVCVCGVGGGGG